MTSVIFAHFSPAQSAVKSFISRGMVALLLILCMVSWLSSPAHAVGTWAPCTVNPFDLNDGLFLLNDGSVLVHGVDFYDGSSHWDTWYRLTPDDSGNYANGTWTQLAISPWGALYFPSMLLSNGQFWMSGGEYTTNTDTDANQHTLLYDPVANKWTSEPDAPLQVSDTGAAMLTDGTILVGTDDPFSNGTQIYDPSSNTWRIGASELDGNGDESSWQLLADGSVFDCIYSGPGLESERYLPTMNEWITAADSPIVMSDEGEQGPLVYLENGQVFCISDNGPTALYTPPTTLTGAGSWSTGPTTPNGDIGADTPAAIEPNGKVLCVASEGLYGPADFYEYDPTSNTFATVSDPLSYQPNPSYACEMLVLPNGQILFTDFSQTLEVYTADSGPNPAWAPTVTNVSQNPDGSYVLTGTQLTGRSYGASYGDDYMPSTDFPIVYLTDASNHLYFCPTTNESTRAIWTGSTPETCQFTVPSRVPAGSYSLFVSVNGIASETAFPLQVTQTNAAPVLSSLTPSSTTQGAASFTLTIAGTGFAAGDTVGFGTDTLTPTSITSTQLQATVPATDVANAGPVAVTVTNASNNTSNSLTFTVNPPALNPSATITTLSPNSATVGDVGFKLTVTGSGIAAGAVVDWNGGQLQSVVISSTEITAVVPAVDLDAVVSVLVTVTNPGADPSNALPFTINPKPIIPAAVLTSISPTSAVVGSPGFTLTVNGTGIAIAAIVNWNGAALSTTYVSSTQVTATVPTSDLATVGNAQVTVTNPGAVASNSIPFTVSPLHSFPAGLQLFSVPYDYSTVSPAAVLGYASPELAVWVPQSLQYVLTPISPADVLRLGQGYWARFPQTVSLDAPGTLASTSTSYIIPLSQGWNMIGDPFTASVDMSTLIILDNGGVQHPFPAAVQSDLVGPDLYSYPAGSTSYQSQSSGTIDPYVGYWILVTQNCNLMVPPPGGS